MIKIVYFVELVEYISRGKNWFDQTQIGTYTKQIVQQQKKMDKFKFQFIFYSISLYKSVLFIYLRMNETYRSKDSMGEPRDKNSSK